MFAQGKNGEFNESIPKFIIHKEKTIRKVDEVISIENQHTNTTVASLKVKQLQDQDKGEILCNLKLGNGIIESYT